MDDLNSTAYLTGKLLLAMPGMADERFEYSVIYICVHDENGAWGLVVNKPLNAIGFAELLTQLEIDAPKSVPKVLLYAGGPVEPGRGFVLHSTDYSQKSTLDVTESIGLTATVDILQAIAQGGGPNHYLVTLGYAGWSAGQLEAEIQDNAWMIADASEQLLFDTPLTDKWGDAMAGLGVDIHHLSSLSGHA